MFKIKDSTRNLNRYIGSSKAKVIDNADPANRGRIRVKHTLIGETSWIEYLNDFGTFSVPRVGEMVYVQCDTGLYEFPFAWGRVPGSYENPNIPSTFRRDVPTNRGFFTPKGHTVELDDGESSDNTDKKLSTVSRGIRITSISGHKIHIYDDPDNGVESINIVDKVGNSIVLDAKNNTILVTAKQEFNLHSQGNVSITTDGPCAIAAKGDAQITTDAIATIKGNAGTMLGSSGSVTVVNGSQVMLAGGGAAVARQGDKAIGFDSHGVPVISNIISGSSKVVSG